MSTDLIVLWCTSNADMTSCCQFPRKLQANTIAEAGLTHICAAMVKVFATEYGESVQQFELNTSCLLICSRVGDAGRLRLPEALPYAQKALQAQQAALRRFGLQQIGVAMQASSLSVVFSRMCAVGLGHAQDVAMALTHEALGFVMQAGSFSAALAPKELLKQVVAAIADPDTGMAAEVELVLKTHAMTDKGGSEPPLRLAAKAKAWFMCHEEQLWLG